MNNKLFMSNQTTKQPECLEKFKVGDLVWVKGNKCKIIELTDTIAKVLLGDQKVEYPVNLLTDYYHHIQNSVIAKYTLNTPHPQLDEGGLWLMGDNYVLLQTPGVWLSIPYFEKHKKHFNYVPNRPDSCR